MMKKKITGYSKYSLDVKKRTKINILKDTYLPLPKKKYQIIYVDPPWYYNGKLQFDKSSKGKDKIDIKKNIFISTASFKYPTLKTEELKKLDVESISDKNSLLFMWTSNPHLDQAIELGKSWGFDYKTVAFVWNKMVHNPGQYNLSYCELCLLFKKGKIPTPRGARNIKQLVEVKRAKHSKKPIEVLKNIEKMFPSQKKLNYLQEIKIMDGKYGV